MSLKKFFIFRKEIKIILDKIKRKNLNNKKIIIVGNSSKSLDKKLGSEIDKFDIVIRFNGAPTAGYEEFVGTKTDIIACNEIIFFNQLDAAARVFHRKNIEKNFIKNQKNKIIFVVLENKIKNNFEYNEIISKNDVIFFGNYLNHLLRYMTISNYNYIKKINFYKFQKNFSLGLIIISIMRLLNLKPYIYGFDLLKDTSNYSCYYSELPNLKSNHDFVNEKQLIDNFLKKKKIFLLE